MIYRDWLHYNPVRIHFGRGCRSGLLSTLEQRTCLIVTSAGGRFRLESDPILGAAVENKKHCWIDNVQENPSLEGLKNQLKVLDCACVDVVVAIGGGSVIDSAKILALAIAPAGVGQSLEALIEKSVNQEIGSGLPLYAVPTTAGTGSEVTPYATMWDYKECKKLSLADPVIYPRLAYVDPELMDTLPKSVTLSSGLDAINQAAESIWNNRMTPVSEALAHNALSIGLEALPKLMANLEDTSARDEMAKTSLLAGLAISQTRTALCHSISYPLTAHFGVPHGLACAFTMPAVLKYNLSVDDGRFKRLARILVDDNDEIKLVKVFDGLNESLNVRLKVKEFIGDKAEVIKVIGEMYTPDRANNSLAKVDINSIRSIINNSWGSL